MSLQVTNMEELPAYRTPGVLIRRSRGYSWVEIRGPGTIRGSTEALIVIDGVENTSRGLLAMNPDDVQRIQVLKGASASIYGIRGANGVLLVAGSWSSHCPRSSPISLQLEPATLRSLVAAAQLHPAGRDVEGPAEFRTPVIAGCSIVAGKTWSGRGCEVGGQGK